jgi:hypothetical protein
MKKLNTIDKVLIGLASFLFVFIIATLIIYTINGWQFDTLITCVLGSGGIEVIASAFIQIAKYKHKKGVEDES